MKNFIETTEGLLVSDPEERQNAVRVYIRPDGIIQVEDPSTDENVSYLSEDEARLLASKLVAALSKRRELSPQFAKAVMFQREGWDVVTSLRGADGQLLLVLSKPGRRTMYIPAEYFVLERDAWVYQE